MGRYKAPLPGGAGALNFLKNLLKQKMSKILVIDDERAIRNTLKEVLEYEKHEVDLAEDGPSGLEIFNANSYDIVALRYQDGKNGWHRGASENN